jgi:hypothetical protein
VRFARHPPATAKIGTPDFPGALAERLGDFAPIEFSERIQSTQERASLPILQCVGFGGVLDATAFDTDTLEPN